MFSDGGRAAEAACLQVILFLTICSLAVDSKPIGGEMAGEDVFVQVGFPTNENSKSALSSDDTTSSTSSSSSGSSSSSNSHQQTDMKSALALQQPDHLATEAERSNPIKRPSITSAAPVSQAAKVSTESLEKSTLTFDSQNRHTEQITSLPIQEKPRESGRRRFVKRSGISDQRLAEIQMMRALRKQLEEARRLSGNDETGGNGSAGSSLAPAEDEVAGAPITS